MTQHWIVCVGAVRDFDADSYDSAFSPPSSPSLFFLIWLASLPPAPSNWRDKLRARAQNLAAQDAELLLRGSATC